MKKITLIALFLFALTSVASAAPLMDFDKGKVAIDYTFRPSLDFTGTANVNGYLGDIPFIGPIDQPVSWSGSRDFNGDANLELGLTVGIGNKWALQYRQYNPTGTIWSNSFSVAGGSVNVGFDAKVRADEYNLLYGFNKNWAGFVGIVRTQGGIKTNLSASGLGGSPGWGGGITIPELWSEQQDNFQFGIVGSYKLAPKTTVWGLASFASDYRNWEAGLSFDLSKDLQLNLSYRDTKYDSLKFAGVSIVPPAGSGLHATNVDLTTDVSVKGWGFGLTYKF